MSIEKFIVKFSETELLKLDAKWGVQYPIVIKSWQNNWEKLTEYFQFTAGIRKLIYTTIQWKGSISKFAR